ncbi:hypothetical protein [Streptomyces sp. V4I2]|uniref:hypothetical protein n=1 Tax=Streptomyces sp. V4I2 TaxID=3042280 RepID=UPI002786C8F5|nr:hypothetical protein [Streptomyces sp. V4I2]MDQ1044972.1 hypothetical protein [Streptomyces sp. V4I2]
MIRKGERHTMNPLDTLIKQHVAPVMKAAGFTKKGRTFRLVAPHGDHLLMEVRREAVDPGREVFDVTFTVVPLSHWEFVNRQYADPPQPDASGALATCPVMPPAEVAHEPDEEMPFRSRWAFVEPDTRDLCGRELARGLTEESIPAMVRLLDRRTLLEETRVNPNGELVRLRGRPMTEIFLRVDDDPVADVTALVDKAEAEGVFAPFVVWARERLARRAAQEH